MNLEQVLRSGVKIVTRIGINNIISSGIKMTTPENASGLMKVSRTIGSLVISNMVMEKVEDFIDNKMNEALKDVKGIREKLKKEIKKEKESVK